ncbi:MAG: hypothetical protein AAFP68_17520 [Pseudomonadota bacterium]
MSDQDKRPEQVEDANVGRAQGDGIVITAVDDPEVIEFHSSDFNTANGADNGQSWNLTSSEQFHRADFNASIEAMENSIR